MYFTCSLLQKFAIVLWVSFMKSFIQLVSVLYIFTESALFSSALLVGRMPPLPSAVSLTPLFNAVNMQCLCAGVFKANFVFQAVYIIFMQNCMNPSEEIKLQTSHQLSLSVGRKIFSTL